ncbi:probable E3 ubiquitin-protein ligase makorin-1 [Topomyia yanbarensis]|uniref:probable E3 ubiquitin-protein ligase makorin-1 n=1 Tax=Topomyia yanbarensis TaxID=2498891 RepID=UPI00273C5C4B|nr:probable E3 ubiquitin-protein ligase makorin-1 [Topomyia yanbarensis]XP_058830261.1 probable E3 ubiquitin-protein ligase makorin-1 [Topomyia yanbarensis]
MESLVALMDAPAGPSTSSKSATEPLAATPASQEICKFYKLGTCRYGGSCRNAHTIDTSSSEIAAQPVPVEQGPSGSSNSSTVPTAMSSSFKIDPLKWINAPEFIPKSKQLPPSAPDPIAMLMDEECDADAEDGDPDENVPEVEEDDETDQPTGSGLSYAAIVTLNNNHNGLGIIEEHADSVLCPYYENSGVCMMEGCPYEHGELCELCGKFCLNPADKEQQRLHNVECIKQHELDMEHSFAIQRSKDKICGICLEVILEKPGREQRFGILPNCNHIFCLECIRTWRKAKNFENKIKRGCPTCRISSDFVCPSIVWVDGRDEKDKLINDYKKACNTTHCKHFKQGSGKCPFGNKCFYKHALPSGQLVDVGGPSRQSENRLRISHLQDFFREVLHQRGRLLDDFMSSFFSDSEDSELSELYDYYDS